ncbi:hypothetical protein L6452_36854 [Arctium lappa]|uniref:Uncharacterized protein n=1 Tax=Arctium lappa TaxID=4217 RepID=A0ACB8Y1T7_ARCLA|nr:hypothetical protein L6452_36854 [Arctium lappa]
MMLSSSSYAYSSTILGWVASVMQRILTADNSMSNVIDYAWNVLGQLHCMYQRACPQVAQVRSGVPCGQLRLMRQVVD